MLNEDKVTRCRKDQPQKFVKELPDGHYRREYQAMHSLTGHRPARMSSDNKNLKKELKPAMNKQPLHLLKGI